jgi:hypothetical protein
MIAELMKNKTSLFNICFSVWIVIFLLCFSAYTQDFAKDVTVELKSKSLNIQKGGNLTFCLTVTNNSQNTFYLVSAEKIRPGYNLTTRELGIGLDLQPTNDHFLEFPKLKKLKPKSKINLNFSLPISAWGELSSGKWTVDAYVGILEEKKLKTKLKDLGFSLEDNIQMTVTDFLALQLVFYSNYISINIQD